jgi:hypothetical protein
MKKNIFTLQMQRNRHINLPTAALKETQSYFCFLVILFELQQLSLIRK